MTYSYSQGSRFDSAAQIRASYLRKHGYLKPKQIASGTLTWRKNGVQTSQIGFRINTFTDSHIELNYLASGTPVCYKIPLVTLKSNLGKGFVWFFVCPATGKRCRVLYGVGDSFLHREAFKRCYYEVQTYSAKSRQLCKLAAMAFGPDKAYQQIQKKYFKKCYAGKITRRYRRLVDKIERGNRIPQDALERLLIS